MRYITTFANGWKEFRSNSMSETYQEILSVARVFSRPVARLYSAESADGSQRFFYLTESQRDSDKTGAGAFAATRKAGDE